MPTPQSNNNDLLNGVLAGVQALNLTLSTTTPPKPVTVLIGKIPKDEKSIESDQLPIIYITPADRPVKSIWWDTGVDGQTPRMLNTYVIEITFIAAGNLDNVNGLPDYTSWRQQCARAVGNPSQVPVNGSRSQTYEVRFDMDPPIDRPAWLANYDLSGMNIAFDVIEPAFGAG